VFRDLYSTALKRDIAIGLSLFSVVLLCYFIAPVFLGKVYLAEVLLNSQRELGETDRLKLEQTSRSSTLFRRVVKESQEISQDDFSAKIDLRAERVSSFIALQFRANSPEAAVYYVNRAAEVLVGLFREEAAIERDLSRDRLQKELSDIDKRIGAIVVELERDPVKSNAIFDVKAGGEELKLARAALSAVSDERIRVESQLRGLEQNPEQNPVTTSGREVAKKLRELSLQKQTLSRTLGPKHPEMIRIETELGTVRDQMLAERETERSNLALTLQELVAKEKTARERFDEQSKALSLTHSRAKYDLSRQEYDSLIALRKKLSDDLLRIQESVNQLSIKELASVARVESSGHSPLPISALPLSFILGVMLSFIKRTLDQRFHSVLDVERRLNLPVLSAVPRIEFTGQSGAIRELTMGSVISLEDSSDELATLHTPQSEASEAYRSLRTALLLTANSEPARVIMITSAEAGEGKSVTACNLAAAFAVAGKSTCLVDGDLRQSGISRILRVSSVTGLGEYLKGELGISQIVTSTSLTKLSVILSGQKVNDSSGLLTSDKLKLLMRELRERFDYVIIDSPAVLPSSDALILSASVDGVSVVLREGDSTAPMVENALARLGRVGATILGVSVNGPRTKQAVTERKLTLVDGNVTKRLAAPVEARSKPASYLSDPGPTSASAPSALKVVDILLPAKLSDLVDFQRDALNLKLADRNTPDLVIFSEPLPGASSGRGYSVEGSSGVLELDRGGGRVDHLAGEISLFLLLDLTKRGISVNSYLSKLLVVLRNTYLRLGAPVIGLEHNVSVGIAVRQGVTYHGAVLKVPPISLSRPFQPQVKEGLLFSLMSEFDFSGITVTSMERCTYQEGVDDVWARKIGGL